MYQERLGSSVGFAHDYIELVTAVAEDHAGDDETGAGDLDEVDRCSEHEECHCDDASGL